MSENMAQTLRDRTITLRSLITPHAIGDLLSLTDEEIAAAFAITSAEYGVKVTYMRAGLRMLVQRILQATSQKK